MLPSHTNVFKVYAFSNLHDFDWTRDNVVAKDLGTVTTIPTCNGVKAELPTDIDELYLGAINVLRSAKPKKVKTVNPLQGQEDYYKNFRTGFVVFPLLPLAHFPGN
jgi:hypothetical protein